MSPRLFAGCLVCLALTACAGRMDRSRPFAYAARSAQGSPAMESYVWARNDGRRMSENPSLLRQGQKDQAECRNEASLSIAMNRNVFAQCMQKRGYSMRLAG